MGRALRLSWWEVLGSLAVMTARLWACCNSSAFGLNWNAEELQQRGWPSKTQQWRQTKFAGKDLFCSKHRSRDDLFVPPRGTMSSNSSQFCLSSSLAHALDSLLDTSNLLLEIARVLLLSVSPSSLAALLLDFLLWPIQASHSLICWLQAAAPKSSTL